MNTENSTPPPETTASPPSLLERLKSRLRQRRHKSDEEKEALSLPPMTRGMQTFSMVAVFLLGAALTWFVVANPFGLGALPQRGPDVAEVAE